MYGSSACFGFRIALDRLAADLGDRTSYSDTSDVKVDVLDVEADEFTKPQTGIRQHGHHVVLQAARYRESRNFGRCQVGVCGLAHGWELGAVGRNLSPPPPIVPVLAACSRHER